MDIFSAIPFSFSIIFITIIGMIFGSFITLLSYRLVHGGAIIVARSKCPKCNHSLHVVDLIPIFSWLWFKGKCHYCRKAISPRYPLTECFTALGFVLCFLAVGWSVQLIILSAITIALTTMIVVDLEHQIIPDEIQIALALLSIAYAYYWHVPLAQMITMAIGLGIFSYGLRYVFWLWKKKEALGLGDVKFFIVVGLYLPFEAIATFLFIAGFSGVILGVIWRATGLGERFPFGPSLAVAFFMCIAFPELSYGWMYRHTAVF